MRNKCVRPDNLSRAVLAAVTALALANPVYAADTEPTSSQATVDQATASDVKPADNSAHNSRDAAGDRLTPLDQSHAEADVETTRSIRQMLVADDSLGTNAQNVKVITAGGMVTLRGAVASEAEKARVVAIAQKSAGLDRVVNELQVITR